MDITDKEKTMKLMKSASFVFICYEKFKTIVAGSV
jgi:hypothetical protein